MRTEEVDGLRVAHFGTGSRRILAVHGITASLMSWRAVAARLPDGWSLVAVDLRGRGHSRDLPGPYGFARHTEDVLGVADHLGGADVLTGHSLGAYVAVLAAAERHFDRVVLIDGGVPGAALPEGTDPDAVLAAGLGPAIARLSQTFPSADAYVRFFQAHPAFAGAWNADVEAYVTYDLVGPEGELHSRAVPEAVRQDGRELLLGRELFGEALKRVDPPPLLLRAPRGLLDQPVGMLPEELVEPWKPWLRDELVSDCNHYTIVFDPRCAALVAERLTAAGGDAASVASSGRPVVGTTRGSSG